MVDFITEVQEELRKDDYNKWLKKYGPFVLGLIVAVIVAAGYYEWDKARKDSVARSTSAAYVSAGDKAADGNVDQAIAEYLALSDVAPTGYAGLSLMRSAELELEKGDAAGAVALLDKAAARFTEARHVQLAQIKAAYILAGQGRYDDVRSRVTLLAEKEQPYEFLARELLGFAAKETGDMQTAREQFSYLERIPGVPQSIQERASQYLSLIKVSSELALPSENDEASIEVLEPEPVEPAATDELETSNGE